MADLETETRAQGRFGGSPNPGAKAPEARSAPRSAAPEPSSGGGISAPSVGAGVGMEVSSAAKDAPIFRIYSNPDGGRDVYMLTPDLESTKLGAVNSSNDDAEKVLSVAGTFNDGAGTWDVPEDVAQSLMKGRLGFTDNIIAKFKAGEANMARNAIGAAYLAGTMTREDAVARGHEELLKVQVGEQPQLAWNGMGAFAENVIKAFKNPIKALRFASGEMAEQVPVLIGSLEAAARGGAKGVVAGGAAAVAGLATGPVGLAAAAPVVTAGAEVGAAFETWKFMSDTEAGSTAMDMLDQGFDDKTVRELAPLAGVVKGTLENVSFNVMTAPFKRGFVLNVLGKDSVKAALAKWYVSYAETIGTEVTTEMAQTRVDQLTQNYAAQVEAKPELLLNPAKAKDQLWETFVKTAAATMLMGAPGAGVDLILGAKPEEGAKVQTAPVTETPSTISPSSVVPAPEPSTPSPQQAHVESVIQSFEKGGASAEEVISAVESETAGPTLAEELGVKPEAAKKTKPSLEQRQAEVAQQARITALNEDLKGTQDLIAVLEPAVARAEKAGQPATALKNEIDRLRTRETGILQDLQDTRTLPVAEAVARQEQLSLKAATLEDIVAAGFKEGRQATKQRAAQVLEVAKAAGLTQGDIKTLLKNKNLGLMGDREFQNWLDTGKMGDNGKHIPSFRRQVADLAEKKSARSELAVALKEMDLKRESRLREINDIPPTRKMTTEQLRDYAKLVKTFEKGDEFLTAKRAEQLKGTEFEGAVTMREVQTRAAELLGKPLEALQSRAIGWWDRQWLHFQPDTQLAAVHPIFDFMVRAKKDARREALAGVIAFREANHKLAAAAIASRSKMSLGERIKSWFVPQQKAVAAYIEAQTPALRAKLAKSLTPEELAWAHGWIDFATQAYTYLVQQAAIEGSRYEGAYIPHVRRPLREMLLGIKDTGVKGFLTELKSRFDQAGESVTAMDERGQPLAFDKFLTNTLHRSGEMAPSLNLVPVFDHYAESIFKKKALDRMVPAVDTLVLAYKNADRSIASEEINKIVSSFTKDFLNAAKGNAPWAVPHGGVIEGIVRFGQNMASLAYINLNFALQAASPVGASMVELPVLGHKGLALAKTRRLTAQGRKILAANHAFIGESLAEHIFDPGKSIVEQTGAVANGMWSVIHNEVMSDLLLGSMTDEEFASGKISEARLTDIEVKAGRWIDIRGSKSVRGSSVLGAGWTQFKGWMIPPIRSTAEDAIALAKMLSDPANKSKRISAQQAWEIAYMAEMYTVGYLAKQSLGEDDPEDQSFAARFRRYLSGELLSHVNALNIASFASGGAGAAWLGRFGYNLLLLAHLWEDEEGKNADKRARGAKGLRKLTPILNRIPQEEQ